jgi:endo-beta-N-acetylglucosaminidase D
VPYPARPVLEVLPQFRGDLKNGYNPFQLTRFDTFVAEQYQAGLSLRQIGELTGRTPTAIRPTRANS